MQPVELEVVIPGYNRPSIEATIESVLRQAMDIKAQGRVAVRACDDAGEHYNLLEQAGEKWSKYENLTISRNIKNLGMSDNLKAMIQASEAEYVLILTDDDTLEEDALTRCLDLISHQNDTAAFLFPRYGWDDDDNLRVKDCVVSRRQQKWIGGTIAHSIRYARHGFILSGLLFRRTAIDLDAWEQVKENAFFPVHVLAKILEFERALYCDVSIVRHRVFNETFWHRWGNDDTTIAKRLYEDFANLFIALFEDARLSLSPREKAKCRYYLWWNLVRERVSWSLIQSPEISPPRLIGGDTAVMIAFRFSEHLISLFWRPLSALYRLRALGNRINFAAVK